MRGILQWMDGGEWIAGARILGAAGRGAMGVVHRAHQPSVDRLVAVKVVAGELASDPEFRARFQREARAAGALNHPHIVTVYDAGEDRGRLYLIMQFVEGDDLASMLGRHGPMPPGDAVEIISQIASALDAAHEQRLIHRDVKPANIMVTRRGNGWHAYLTDFGITTRVGEAGLTRAGLAIGTLDYMAPEQLTGDPYDHRADVYALGAVLFQALTGTVPFPRDTDAARIYAHLNAPVPDVAGLMPSAAGAAVVPALASVVRRALAKQPALRFGSAGELAAATRAALDGGRAVRVPRDQAYAPTSESVPGRKPRRRALILGGTAAVVAAGLGAAYAVPRLGDRGQHSTGPGTLGLPDDLPAGEPLPQRPGPFKVGVDARMAEEAGGYLWVASFKDSILTRIDPAAGRWQHLKLKAQAHNTVVDGNRVWVLGLYDDMVALTAVDVHTARLTGEQIDLPQLKGAGPLTYSERFGLLWLGFGEDLVRVDLKKQQIVTTSSVSGGELASLSVDDKELVGLDRKRSQIVRLDAGTGKRSAESLPVSSEHTAVVKVRGQTIVGGGGIGIAPLKDGNAPKTADYSLPNFAITILDESAWGVNLETSELFRLRDDLTATTGAPVKGAHGRDETLVAGNSTRLYVVDPVKREARIYAVEPLRKM